MIHVVDTEKNGISYNRCLELSDWRFSAAAVGMIRFFCFRGSTVRYYIDENRKLYYRFADIDLTKEDVQERYLQFVEDRFVELMHHKIVLEYLEKQELSDDDKKSVNEKLAANSIMKQVFKGVKYENTDREVIKKKIFENRYDIVRSTFVNSISGYRKFSTISCFGKGPQDCCRLLGYYVDTGRKTKSLGFNFNKKAAPATDTIEFDFIPFAFSKSREAIFINNNTSFKRLLETNDRVDDYFNHLIEQNVSWNSIFYRYLNSSGFLRQDTEIIMKQAETDYYETVFVRKAAIDTFLEIYKKKNVDTINNLDRLLKVRIKVNDNYYLNMTELVTKAILDGRLLDDVIERILKIEAMSKDGPRYGFVLGQLILINMVLYKKHYQWEVEMDSKKDLKSAYVAAKEVTKWLKEMNAENKVNGYRQRLSACMVANDYDRFIKIMLQLSSYTQKSFYFMHPLLRDFEANKNLAYQFIIALGDEQKPAGNETVNNVKEDK